MHFVFRALIVGASVLIGCLMPALLLHYLGFEIRVDWNDNAVETGCTVIDHYTQSTQCSYSCNCYTYSCGKSSCTSCDTCYYVCYDSYVAVEYMVLATETTTVGSEKVTNDDSEAVALAEAQAEYPIGNSSTCYYLSSDTSDWRWEKHDTTGFVVGFWLFISIGIITLGIWTGYEVYKWYENRE